MAGVILISLAHKPGDSMTWVCRSLASTTGRWTPWTQIDVASPLVGHLMSVCLEQLNYREINALDTNRHSSVWNNFLRADTMCLSRINEWFYELTIKCLSQIKGEVVFCSVETIYEFVEMSCQNNFMQMKDREVSSFEKCLNTCIERNIWICISWTIFWGKARHCTHWGLTEIIRYLTHVSHIFRISEAVSL